MIKQINLKDAIAYSSDCIYSDADRLMFISNPRQFDFPDGAIQPGFFIYGYCAKGAGSFSINGQKHDFRAGDIYLNVGNQTLDHLRGSDDFEGHSILVSYQFLQEGIAGMNQLWPFLLYLYEHPVIHLEEDERERMEENYSLALRRLGEADHHYRRELTATLIRLYYFDICDILSRRCPEEWNRPTRSYDIFDRFIHLAGEHFREQRNVIWYSRQLCLTPKYLSEVVKSVSGKTAGQWISDFVLMEIKMLLRSTGLSVKEITNKMNFPNQSFLGKYFKNATGQSPSAYRNN